MSSPFAQPSAGGDKFEPRDYNGRLLLIYPKSYKPATETKFGESESADVDVIVVDQVDPTTGQPVSAHNARLFGNLARSVRDDVGGTVLGRLGQGPNTKGNPPWILLPHSDADAQQAGPVHQQYQAGLFKPKDPPPQQAAQPPFGGAPDPYALPPAPPPQQYAPPPPQPQAAAPAAPDPTIAFLLSKGLPFDQVNAMTPQTRQQLASTYQ